MNTIADYVIKVSAFHNFQQNKLSGPRIYDLAHVTIYIRENLLIFKNFQIWDFCKNKPISKDFQHIARQRKKRPINPLLPQLPNNFWYQSIFLKPADQKVLENVSISLTVAYLEPSQVSIKEIFAKIANG